MQNKVASKVTAGENGGRTLHHDFVVRQWLAPLPIGPRRQRRAGARIAAASGAPAGDFAVTAFVQSARGEVLQAFSLPVCASAG